MALVFSGLLCSRDYKGSWVPKNWCFWRRLLRVPWRAKRSNQSILREINSGYSLEGLMLKLKLQYFGHLVQRTDSLEKTLMLRKIEGRRRRGWQRTRWFWWLFWLNGREFEQTPGDGEGQGSLACCSLWGCKESDTTELTKQEQWKNGIKSGRMSEEVK